MQHPELVLDAFAVLLEHFDHYPQSASSESKVNKLLSQPINNM